MSSASLHVSPCDHLKAYYITICRSSWDRTDILNVLRGNYRISEAANDSQSTTMIRINELHVKAGIAIQQQYAGKPRRIVNQHNTETVSRYTLPDILKEKSLHLCMCLMCNEDDLRTKLLACFHIKPICSWARTVEPRIKSLGYRVIAVLN
jgi:hypothetical protein